MEYKNWVFRLKEKKLFVSTKDLRLLIAICNKYNIKYDWTSK